MGCECVKSRPLSYEEELTIQTYEDSLGFSSISCSKFTQTLTEITTSPHLSRSQLEELISRTGIRSCPLGNQEHPIVKLYAWLKTGTDWSATKLVALSLVLSPGKWEKKAKIVFNSYVFRHQLEINEHVLQEWLGDICLIALKLIPEMTEGLLREENLSLEATQVANYRKKLENSLEECKTSLKTKVLGTDAKSISESEFIEKSLTLQELFSSRSLRELALSLWKRKKLPSFQGNKSQKQRTVDLILPLANHL